MSSAAGAAPLDDRTPEQVAGEKIMREVESTLTNFDWALARARKALVNVRKAGGNQNVELELQDLIDALVKARKPFVQGTYYSGDSIRLI